MRLRVFRGSDQPCRSFQAARWLDRESGRGGEANQIHSCPKRRSIRFDVYAARVQFQSVLGRKLSSSAAQQQSQEQTRRRRNQERLARVFARVVFGFAGNLVKVFALQVLDLLADDISLLVYVIVGL